MLGGGVAVYANGSINKAEAQDTGKQISGAPEMTAGLGLLWQRGPWSTSLIYKRTGATPQVEYSSSPATYDSYRIAARDNTDLGIAYTLENLRVAKSVKLQWNVFNLMDRDSVTSISAASSAAGDQYLFQAPRSMQFSVKTTF